jgi:hypothetical protein
VWMSPGLVCPYLHYILDEERILSDSAAEVWHNAMVPISEARLKLVNGSFQNLLQELRAMYSQQTPRHSLTGLDRMTTQSEKKIGKM